MQLHVLGICGTFMGGIAVLARELGHQVSGSDQNVYPPMSTQLENLGMQLQAGYLAEHCRDEHDVMVIGNALSRGNALVEHILNTGKRYQSGPAWLADHVLSGRHVLAVAGTHGKTTTTSLLAWILENAGANPGFLVGGVPQNFGISARLGGGKAFVIEADEYDSAFFDKRSKFVHYQPRVAILNNLEFDHADIFDSLADIERQFHHLVRTIPAQGCLIVNGDDANLTRVLSKGCWTPVQRFSINNRQSEWYAQSLDAAASQFDVYQHGQKIAQVEWSLAGTHNMSNALAAIAAAHAYGVSVQTAAAALQKFLPPKRRLEHLGKVQGIDLFDDFAHHPTAIEVTLAALRARFPQRRLHAVLEPRSNTMRMGVMRDALASSLATADHIWLLAKPELKWNAAEALGPLHQRAHVAASSDALLAQLQPALRSDDVVVFMSNGGFDGIQKRLQAHLLST